MSRIAPAAALMTELAAHAAFAPISDDAYRLEAPLTFATVAALRNPGLALIAAAKTELTIDLEAVPAVDSAGLALLIDWLATARARSCQLRYAKPAETLLALARLSEVEALLSGGWRRRGRRAADS
ncbi:MAG TPA: STAS domain-containing protein [Steroidobacteraceae bacterium]|nr:STAS domain-containing protein [Steroidobacteraceae bacterium]